MNTSPQTQLQLRKLLGQDSKIPNWLGGGSLIPQTGNGPLDQQVERNQQAGQQAIQDIQGGFNVGGLLANTQVPQIQDNVPSAGLLPPLGAVAPTPVNAQPQNSFALPPQNTGFSGLPSASPPSQGVGFNNQTTPQEPEQSNGNLLSNFFTGTLEQPNGLLRLAEGYNRGGLVGALGMLGTNFSPQNNQTSVQDRIRKQRQGGY